MARFILVHGAWHGGWCWEEIVPRLEAQGHRVLAPDLPGMGKDAASGHVATLDEWAMFVGGMARADADPAILVGHSRGGIVISRTAEIAPDAVRSLVYLAAVMPLPGQSMADIFDAAEQPRTPHVAAAVSLSPDARTLVWHDRASAVAAFYAMTPADKAAAAFERLTPEPSSMRDAPVVLTADRYGRIPRSFIHCEQDAAVMIDLQRAMVRRQPCRVRSLPTDHSPFYSAPHALAEMLDELAD